MTSTHEQAILILNGLATICCDAQEGFRAAAAHIQDAGLRTMFHEFASKRAHFAEELHVEVRLMGGEPTRGGSMAGAVERGWMIAKNTMFGPDDVAIVAACQRGEEAGLEDYRQALLVSFSTDTSRVLQRQRNLIQASRDRLLAWTRLQPQNV